MCFGLWIYESSDSYGKSYCVNSVLISGYYKIKANLFKFFLNIMFLELTIGLVNNDAAKYSMILNVYRVFFSIGYVGQFVTKMPILF